MDRIDVLKITVPLMEKLLEHAREKMKSDMDVHILTEKLVRASKTKPSLGAADFPNLIKSDVKEIKEIRRLIL